MSSKRQRHQVRRGSRTAAAGIVILIIAVFRPTTLYAQAPALPMAAMVAAKAEAAPADVETHALRVLVGRSALVDTGSSITRVSLTSADIADALVTAPSQLLVNGKMPGTISMFVWDRAGAVRRYDVIVQRDLSRLSEQVKQLFPGESIEVQSNGRNVVVSGLVSSKDVIEKAVNVASGYVEKKEEVVSLLQIREDGASNQVLLRVRFAEVSRSAVTELGASFFTSPTGVKNNIVRATTQQFAAPAYDGLAWTKANTDFGSDVTSASGKITFSDFLNFFLFNEKLDLGVMIKALQTKGLFQSLAEPNLVAESGKEASFLAGGEFPIPIAQGSGGAVSISVQFKEFGIRLNFTPVVTGNRVHLKVRPEVSALDFSNAVVLNGFRIPALTTRRTETEIELLDGQTFAIAGLLNSSMNSTLQKVPGIGDIPILGALFRSKAAQKDRTELVVIITPHILPRNSTGVTSELPRLQEPFLPALPGKTSLEPPPPAFQPRPPGSVNDTTAVPAPAARKGPAGTALDPAAAAAAVSALTPTTRTVVRGDAAQKSKEVPVSSGAHPLTADEKKAQERAHKQEEAAKAAEATQMTRQSLEDRRKQAAEQKRQAALSREQGKRDAEAARRAAEQAKRQAEIDKKQAEIDRKRQKQIAEAGARLEGAEARFKADVAQKDKP
jgi:pilus assembly protein CpaC